jgi:hypothetical protein
MKDAEAKMMVDLLMEENQQSDARKKMQESDAFAAEFAALKQTWDDLGDLPDSEPPAGMQKRFYNQLQAYANGHQDRAPQAPAKPGIWDTLRWWLLPVAAAACVFFGVFLGQRTATHVAQPIQPQASASVDLVGLMAQSPAERLSVLQSSRDLVDPDERVLQALLHVLRTDESVNVRLGAVDALTAFGSSAIVREGLVRALPSQESPMVQIALIDALIEMQGLSAKDSIEQLLEIESVNPLVRQHASDSIEAWR